MSVNALYYSSRDGEERAMADPTNLLFASKKEADERDKMLELAEELREFLTSRVEGLSEELADQCAVALAKERDLLGKALKKPSLLNATTTEQESE